MSVRTTRLAPSPTGTLHLGNVRTFLINWAIARQRGWKIIMRIEDLDATRVRSESVSHILSTLEWLGINFDEGPYTQSFDLEPYRQAIRRLTDLRAAYACKLTRSQIRQAASAPHRDEQEVRYPAELRPASGEAFNFDQADVNYRFVTPEARVTVHDCLAGAHEFCPADECGDFVIWTKLGVPAYQLAVVVDDARQGITDVVRGDDLLASAARQTLLYQALGSPLPNWWHVPLVLGPDGSRLAKRDGASHLQTVREANIRPERVIGLLAKWCGVQPLDTQPREIAVSDFLERFDIATLPKCPINFSRADHDWLFSR